MQEYYIAWWILPTFLGVSPILNSPFIFWNRAEKYIGQSFEEYLRGGKHVKKMEIYWMNNKTIIEFGFR